MRWSLALSKYNLTITYIKGKDNIRADALSRREQDMLDDATDERIDYRTKQLLKFTNEEGQTPGIIKANPVQTQEAVQAQETVPDDERTL